MHVQVYMFNTHSFNPLPLTNIWYIHTKANDQTYAIDIFVFLISLYYRYFLDAWYYEKFSLLSLIISYEF